MLTGIFRTSSGALQVDAGTALLIAHPDMICGAWPSRGGTWSKTEHVAVEGDARLEIGRSDVHMGKTGHEGPIGISTVRVDLPYNVRQNT
jgi:hypothetical protein